MEDSYKNGIEENKFIDEFVHEFNPSLNYNETQILNSLNNLCILDAICIEDGKIYLKEKIVKVI